MQRNEYFTQGWQAFEATAVKCDSKLQIEQGAVK